jgi:hypothetical protein
MAEKFGVEGAKAHAERDTAEMAFGEPERIRVIGPIWLSCTPWQRDMEPPHM